MKPLDWSNECRRDREINNNTHYTLLNFELFQCKKNKHPYNTITRLRKDFPSTLLCLMFIILFTTVKSHRVNAQTSQYFHTDNGIPCFPVLATPPSNSSNGAIYINSRDKMLYRYNGTKWVPICSPSVKPTVKPTVKDVSISTDITVGSIAFATYSYVPDNFENAAESNTTYRWYWAADSL